MVSISLGVPGKADQLEGAEVGGDRVKRDKVEQVVGEGRRTGTVETAQGDLVVSKNEAQAQADRAAQREPRPDLSGVMPVVDAALGGPALVGREDEETQQSHAGVTAQGETVSAPIVVGRDRINS